MRFLTLLLVLATSFAFTQNNPLPQIAQPMNPTHRAPGLGSDFTIVVRGANFVPGSVVNWNGSPRSTTFVSAARLEVTILAADVATAGTGTITVTNPSPGGGTSDPLYFPVHRPEASIALARRDIFPSIAPNAYLQADVIGDFNGDGKADIAVVDSEAGILVFRGTGAGTFGAPILTPSSLIPPVLFAADVNHDGNLDLIGAAIGIDQGQTVVFLGDGTGAFSPQPALPIGGSGFVFGDFNQDGNLDLIVNQGNIVVYFGRGDGTFSGPIDVAQGDGLESPIVGDFTGAGRLELLVPQQVGPSSWVLNMFFNQGNAYHGKGSGFFLSPNSTSLPLNINRYGVAVGDFNHDGKLDIVTDSGLVLLGKGDGTFTVRTDINISSVTSIRAADMNNDGNLDVVVQNEVPTFGSAVTVLLGNGDGTFQSPQSWDSEVGEPSSIAVADLNGDGLLDAAIPNVNYYVDYAGEEALSTFLQTSLNVSPDRLFFGVVPVGATATQVATLTNLGPGTVKIDAIKVAGGDIPEYSDTTTCGSTLAPGTECTVSVTFAPKKTSPNFRTALITIQYNEATGPQHIYLWGDVGTN